MSQGVSVLVIFSSKALNMVVAILDWTLFRALVLMSEHVRFQVLEDLATLRICTATLFSGFFTTKVVLAAEGAM
jgi:hypothetical protein